MSRIACCRFLVLDNEHLLQIHNLRRKVNPAQKHTEPVLRLDAPWDRADDMLNYLNVLYDSEAKVFRMWYVVYKLVKGQYFEGGRKTGYAVSRDGIHWEKPVMNRVESDGSTRNNYIFPEMGSLTFTILDDPSDVPSRRYKMIFQVEGREMQWGGFHMPLNLAYSADGIQWDRPTHVNPVMRGVSDGGWGFFYDADRRKYVLLTRRVPNVPRDISRYESYDLVNWEDRGRVLVPGDAHDPPELFNYQSMTPFGYDAIFHLGLLNTNYSLPGAESYEVFHKPPASYPRDVLGKVDVQLAYSRDGQAWSRPQDRSPILVNGEPGSPDAGMIFVPSSNPFVIDGETYMYYLACPQRHNAWSKREETERAGWDGRKLAFGMLARMPEDHWVSLDAGTEEGWFLTQPWVPPQEVCVNADIAHGGSIAAELLTPYGEPMPGFSRADCIPLTVGDKRQAVRWKSERVPYEFQNDHLGGVCAKFYLRNAKLYAYTFYTLPDPHGRIEREGLNYRWLEHMKHRSDNWGRDSHEPAAGVPPYVVPGPTGEQS